MEGHSCNIYEPYANERKGQQYFALDLEKAYPNTGESPEEGERRDGEVPALRLPLQQVP